MKETIETAYAQMQKDAKRFADSLDVSDFVQKISEEAYLAGELFIASKIFNAKPSMKEIDWEQRRYEIAMRMLCNNPHGNYSAEESVRHADLLIEELKKTSKCTN